ncbi:MAG TPA: NAD(P)/FAD-dependent oxidoreductase [Candidatus Binatia bacterium]
MEAREYDVVVLGAGPTGENVAGRVRGHGLSAAIVESELVGGECSYWACMPSKALLRPIHALEHARAVAGAREAATGALDVAAVLARRDDFAAEWDDAGQVRWLVDTGIDLVRGRGRLAGERRVVVEHADGGRTELRARHAVAICTGSRAAIPDVPGLAEAKPWTSREATSARSAPARLAILGGGVVACEMAVVWRALGAREVTILQRAERLVPGFERFASEILRAALEARGVRVRTKTSATAVERRGDAFRLVLPDGDAVECDQILVAAGRAPRTDDIGLETVGLEPGSWLDVDDSLRVRGIAGGWLYAAGDVNHRALLTHMGKYQARVCGDAIHARVRDPGADGGAWSQLAATADVLATPQVVFTEPELASVGLTEAQARERGFDVRVADYDIGHVAGASLYADGYAGRARVVVDQSRRVLVGATLVGPAVGELLHAATVAIAGEVPLERLRHAVPSYPTVSEIWLRLLEELGL